MAEQRTTRFLAGAAVALSVVAIVAGVIITQRPDVCDGISRDVGGCERDQPTFAGTQCRDVGREIGGHVDDRVMAIIGRQRSSPNSKAVDILQAEVLVVQRASQHLRGLGTVDECDAETLMAAMEEELSPELRSSIGAHLYDEGGPRPYEEWRSEMLGILRVVDVEEEIQDSA